jgi:hypothetical protein
VLRVAQNRRKIRGAFLVSFLIMALKVIMPVYGGTNLSQQPTEYEVKAAFLYNFAKFVDWPVSAFPADDSVLIVGVLGSVDIVEVLDQIIGQKTVKNRRIVIHHFEWYRDIEFCHILFVSNTESKRLRRLFNHIGSKPILTVGDQIEGFAQTGGIINFTINDKLINFEINPNVATQHNLAISSKLLRLATIIETEMEAH